MAAGVRGRVEARLRDGISDYLFKDKYWLRLGDGRGGGAGLTVNPTARCW